MGEPVEMAPMDISAPQDMNVPVADVPFYLASPLLDAPIGAPAFNGTQPYVISNYVIGGMDMLLLVVSVLCVALQLRKKKGLRDGGPSMLFVHVGLFAAGSLHFYLLSNVVSVSGFSATSRSASCGTQPWDLPFILLNLIFICYF
jgi:hypothetical protein